MGNNDLNETENILIKVDSNNLIYIDPNSVVNKDNEIESRSVRPENLVIYVNLEADIIPRTILTASGEKTGGGRLQSIAKGTLNFLSNNGKDFDTTWTDAFNPINSTTLEAVNIASQAITGVNPGFKQNKNDVTGQSFGIESININIKGWGIPTITINFTDVRGKTLFESPKDSPYRAFFHLPWPIFYLTVKGYYGKAIRYRLHMSSFTSKFNESNGNFDITTTFIGSTYAHLADIPINAVLNSAYMFGIEKEQSVSQNGKEKVITKKISKSSKGYSILSSVYDEYKTKGLIDKNFPVKTLREVITIAKTLDKILEKQIFDQVVNPKIFQGIKDLEKDIQDFKNSVKAWSQKHLSNEQTTINGVNYQFLAPQEKNQLTNVTGGDKNATLENILKNYQATLKKSTLFAEKYMNKTGVDFKKVTFNVITEVDKIDRYYTQYEGKYVVTYDTIVKTINKIEKTFNTQKTKIQDIVEKKMNEIIKDPSKGGFGFEPTIRNIFAIILANADVYVRLMKDIHNRAFEVGDKRRQILRGYTDETPKQNAIYPWPEIKKQTADSTQKVLCYPGDPDLFTSLQSNDKTLWPEVDFVENYIEIATKKSDPLSNKEGAVEKINYVFDNNESENKIKPISDLLDLKIGIPYVNKSISSVIYEIYERAVISCYEPFNNKSIKELADIEFENIQNSFEEDYDIINSLKFITGTTKFKSFLYSYSPYERHQYYVEKLPTTQYIQSLVDKPFDIDLFYGDNDKSDKSGEYEMLSLELKNYKPDNYRKNVYPYNSSTYLSYLNKKKFEFTNFDGNFYINTKDGFINTVIEPNSWVKIGSGFTENMFTNKLEIGNNNVNILNTPYFHKQLFTDFTKTNAYGKYSGSAYLLLNSLPFYELNDYINFGDDYPSILVSSLFKEISATHYIPYHLILKWGSIYHRYKTKILEDKDILDAFLTTGNTTTSISGKTFFDLGYTGTTGTTFDISTTTGITYNDERNVGFYPVYQSVFHQIINDFGIYDINMGNADFSGRTNDGQYNARKRRKNGLNYWTSYVDNSKTSIASDFYTLLPCDGANDEDNLGTFTGFTDNEQSNYRIIWDKPELFSGVTFSGQTFNSHKEYLKSIVTGVTVFLPTSVVLPIRVNDNKFTLNQNYRKVIDLIGTFRYDILDKFEEYFLQFASERENVEIEFKTFPDYTDSTKKVHSVKYQNFQDILTDMVKIKKEASDGTDTLNIINSIITKQTTNLKNITKDILSYDNLIKLRLSNPREFDYNKFESFAGINTGNTINYNDYNLISQSGETKYIELYIGEDIDGNYLKFFSTNNIELSETNILDLRPLIQIFAGWLKDKKEVTPSYTPTKKDFQKYIIDNILVKIENRINTFTDQLTYNFANNLKSKDNTNTITINKGYNMNPVKLDLYKFFKTFNDKWSSGNSIGQRGFLEDFLFLDKANKDIGNIAYLSLDKLISLDDTRNDSIDLYSMLSSLLTDSGFDMRPMPAYVNFYGTNFNSKIKTTPSKKAARDIFGTFLEVDYQESSPKVVLQYMGNFSAYADMSDISGDDFLYNDDSFNVGELNKNPLIITLPNAFDEDNLDKSNKVVAFEVSIGDQNQGIFKSIQIDQSSIKNTAESFPVLENIARSESGAAAYEIDTSLFGVYSKVSYLCEVTMMGDVMIQPTMYFYLKNIPMFKGTYLITEVTHNIKNNKITTSFKGARIASSSLPNPKDSFVTSYRVLFEKITNKAIAQIKNEEAAVNAKSNTEKSITTDKGTSTVDMGNSEKQIPQERLISESGINGFGLPYNGYNNEKDIQYVEYDGEKYFRAVVATMGGNNYNIKDSIEMSILNGSTEKPINNQNVGFGYTNKITWKDIKNSKNYFYSSKFDIRMYTCDNILKATTTFFNPKNKIKVEIPPIDNNITVNNVTGPINIGPSVSGYGMGLSVELMKKLGLKDNDVVYFQFK